jgi:proteasome-associated ATPase
MPQTAQRIEEEFAILNDLLPVGDGALNLEQKLELVQAVRGRSRDRGVVIDRFFLEHLTRKTVGLAEATAAQAQLKEIVDNLVAPPWYPVLLDELIPVAGAVRAVVVYNGVRRLVNVAQDVGASTLAPGDEVYLSHELNVVVGKSPAGIPRYGETARFERYTADERIVLKSRDEEFVVRMAGALGGITLQPGDQLRWDHAAWVAFEKLDCVAGKQYLLGEVPNVSRDQVGGQERNLESLLAALTATLIAPERAARYGLSTRSSTLMWGPPGVGKTLMARVAATELMRVSGKRCRIGVVKPAEWESPWVGETQQNIRNCFAAAAREAEASGGFTILFLDEIEAIGRIRGGSVGQHSDRFLAALLAELDGFSERSNVAVIAATNRKDLVDPALLERLSDVEIAVSRPDLRAARAIFGIHLPEALPYSPNGTAAATTRDELIDTAVSRFYSPNAANDLCVLKFRDGKTRTVAARDLASGRIFEQVCRAARRSAFLRDVRDGDPGLRVTDIEDAVSDAFERLATTLSLRNAHAYLGDLPQDVDVVSVEPIKRKLTRPHRYLN